MRSMLAFALMTAFAALARAEAVVGQPAPPFSAADVSGKTVSLADFKGKYVVLEWINPGCPYVQKHYNAANMQATQKAAAGKGVAWLAVNSTATDHRDYRKPADMAAWMRKHQAAATATLMDVDGKVGRAYGARATPHLYIVDPAGKVVYAGAIDSKPTANPSDIAGATNYVNQALSEALAGKPVSVASTRAYGCTIKYASGA
jgi:peroxiredoxin